MGAIPTEKEVCMRRFVLIPLLLLLATAFAMAQSKSEPQKETQPKPIRALDLSALDKTANPCTDFYQYACGGWIAQNPIPADQPAWGRFNELSDNNLLILRSILEKAEIEKPGRSALDQKIGDFYASCMDEKAIDAKGLAPLEPELKRIDAITSKAELPAYLAQAHVDGINSLFNFGAEPDAKNASMTIAGTDQGGLGLPDRDYYLKTDPKSVQLRTEYQAHVQKMLELAGVKPEVAAADAKAVMTIETELAKASMSRVDRRVPSNTYHKMTVKELQALSPDFNWNEYIVGLHTPAFDSLDVSVPGFVKGFNGVLADNSLSDIKAYLTWHAIHSAAGMLPTAFVNETFNFYGKELTGAKQLRPRWKRCVGATDGALGEDLGQAFVAQTFGPDGKARMLDMVKRLEASLHQDIQTLPWMTETTKKQALIKLAAIQNKIGYPDHWRDYSALKIVRGDALGNTTRAAIFESRRELNKIGKPVNKNEWGMTPPTVNAYYNPLENNINFPAGILQPPFFDKNASDASNFGGIGAVIGHELTHGFDDEGRHYDAQGNLKDWWTEKDSKAFDERTACLVNEYDGFSPIPGVHLNGKLTLGENTADNGGVRIALNALETKDGKGGKSIDGFTPEQQFFLGWAQVWCQSTRPEFSRMLANVDPHSPGQFRVNGVLGNMTAFQKAWGCKVGQPMVRANACRVW